MNLLLNALDVLPKEGGEVIVTTREHADRVLDIIVYDNGPGIPEGKADEIFKPFFTTKGSAGTGLGLPMCRKIAEDLGGRITVDDTPGKGAAFTVSLPLLKPRMGSETQVTKF
jgi:signal transduction histidine kinase